MRHLKQLIIILSAAVLAACGGADTSVENVDVTAGDVPSNLVGVYTGTISARAEAGLLRESFSEPVTITVRADNTVTFAGDDPDEVFTTNIGSNGGFNGRLQIVEDDCDGVVNVSGIVNGTTATGELGGEGECRGIDVDLTGTFSASR